jgi:microcystin-dependent protein
MADTTFTDNVTVTAADWFNDINRLHYTIFSDPTNIAAVKESILPAGMVVPYAGTSAPTDWLACDGAAVSRTTYSRLFTAISTTWGVGDGSTTFNVPFLGGRVPIGSGTGTTTEDVTASSGNGFTVTANDTKWITGMTVVLSALTGFTTSMSAGPTYYAVRVSSTNVRFASTLALAQAGTPDETISGTGTATLTHTYTARTVGQYGGEQEHAQKSTEQLLHTHTQDSHTHTITAGVTGGGSTTAISYSTTLSATDTTQGANGTTATNQNTGGNVAANIMQPFAVTMYIIKT